MSKHTPGPWVYRPSNSGHFIAGAGDNSGYLAEVRHCRTSQDVKADARLIAAAPELLEALEGLLSDDMGKLLVSCGAAEVNAVRKAVNAIAKATGEQP